MNREAPDIRRQESRARLLKGATVSGTSWGWHAICVRLREELDAIHRVDLDRAFFATAKGRLYDDGGLSA
jgi:hypothetical protein